ncbi:MAG: copper chaperone PCu(A)C [Microthrixaceae bacterium]
MSEPQVHDDTTAEPEGETRPAASRRPVVVVVVGLVAVLAITAVVALLAGRDSSPTPAIEISQPRAGERVGTTVAVYLDLRNDGGEDTITAAASPVATGATLHEMDPSGLMIDGAGIPVAASATTALEPGGSHVMLTGVGADLAPGAIVPVTLTFERSGDRTVDAVVRPLAELADGGRS